MRFSTVLARAGLVFYTFLAFVRWCWTNDDPWTGVTVVCKTFWSLPWRVLFKIALKITDKDKKREGPGFIYHYSLSDVSAGTAVKIGSTVDLHCRIQHWKLHYAGIDLENLGWTAVGRVRKTEDILHIIHEDSRYISSCFNRKCRRRHRELFVMNGPTKDSVNVLATFIYNVLLFCYEWAEL